MKYVILNIDTECGGEAYLSTANSEAELKENVGGYSIAVKEDIGIKFYNDDEDEYSTSILLNEKGLKEFRDALNGADPFDKNKFDYKSWLSGSDGDDSDDE
jgi:hypothetical protein